MVFGILYVYGALDTLEARDATADLAIFMASHGKSYVAAPCGISRMFN